MSLARQYNQNQHSLEKVDNEIYKIIIEEEQRQHTKLEMIASENFASRAILEATGSVLTNKYAEGYPGKRYYGGCEVVDKAEVLAIERAKALFNAEYANVQPHSGSSANFSVFLAFLNPGDTLLGMDLAHGGHLTHGSQVSVSGKYFNALSYGVSSDTFLIDYDQVRDMARKHRPKMIIAGTSSYPRVIDFERFAQIAEEVSALLLVDMAHISGLVAAGCHPSPIAYAHVVTTTTHKTLRGPRGGLILVGKNRENPLGIKNAKGNIRTMGPMLNSSVMPGVQGGPLMHVVAAKAVAFKECMSDAFVQYQKDTVANSVALAASLIERGCTILTGGTDNHLLLVDVRNFKITGKEAEEWLDTANISANKNGIPFDTQSPLITSGIRLGLPAITSRGMTVNDMNTIADFIVRVFTSEGKQDILHKVANEVQSFSSNYPIRR